MSTKNKKMIDEVMRMLIFNFKEYGLSEKDAASVFGVLLYLKMRGADLKFRYDDYSKEHNLSSYNSLEENDILYNCVKSILDNVSSKIDIFIFVHVLNFIARATIRDEEYRDCLEYGIKKIDSCVLQQDDYLAQIAYKL